MAQNPLIANKVHSLSDNSITDTVINFGQSSEQNSGTGIYGSASAINFAVGGSLIAQITASGIVPMATQLANKVLAGPATGSPAAPTYRSLVAADLPYQILVLTSSAGAGGATTEAMTVTGLAVSDTILSVSQKTPGGNSLPLLGYSTQASNSLTAIFSADPGAGAVIVVAIKR